MTESEKLQLLGSRLRPIQGGCESCGLSQQELVELLRQCGGDVDKASYYACMRLAECTAMTTPELETESSREYWLSMARLYRPNRNHSLERADREGKQC